jgi:hypothetical protein
VLSASLRPAGAPGAVVQAPKAAAAAPAGKPAAAPKGAPPPVKAARAGDKGPDDILLKPIAGTAAKRPPTPFTHKKHYDDYGVKCAECHHLVKALGSKEPPQKTCTEAGCHTADQCNRQVVPAKNKACPFFEDAFHLNCIECHRSQKGPTKCAECHAG